MSWTVLTIFLLIVVGLAGYLLLNYRKLVAGLPHAAGAGGSSGATEGADVGASTMIIGSWVIVFALVGVAAIATWSFGQNDTAGTAGPWRTLGLTALIGLASGAVGALLGFIFGMPRTLDAASRVAVASAATQSNPAVSSQAALAANTNLERISDWLTTLLIGATLVQSGNVIAWVGGLGERFQGDLTIKDMAPLVVVYYFALGFLGTYLVTRLYLTYALQQTLALLTGVKAGGPKIEPQDMPKGAAGAPYPSTPLRAVGGTSPLTWGAHQLPPGLSLDPVSGTVSGTPTAAGKDKYIVVVTDASTPPNSDATQLEIEVQ